MGSRLQQSRWKFYAGRKLVKSDGDDGGGPGPVVTMGGLSTVVTDLYTQ